MASPLLYIVALCTIILLDLPVQGLPIEKGIEVLNRQDSQHVIAQKNVKLLLNCSVTSKYGVPEITWLKNGVPLNLDNRISKDVNGSLFFKKVVNKRKKNITDEGLYECLAANSKGMVLARRVKLEISGISGKFSRQPEDQTVEEGAVARFQCNIRASPPPLYTWLKDDEHLNNDDRHIIISTGILQILDVGVDDAGHYWCTATPGKLHDLPDQVDSIKWKKSNPATLTVKPGTGNRPLTIKSGPVNTTVQEGQSVVLECLVDGTPQPEVTWERDDGTDATVAAVKYGFSNLKVLQVTVGHSGVYICKAESGGKKVSARATLTVHTRPVITRGPQSVQYVPAHSTRFECVVDGNPRPRVQWLRNGTKIMPAANHQIKQNNDLVITGTVPQNSGYYQCVVENSVDYDMRIARLEILPIESAPLPPQGIHVQVLSATAIFISWDSSSQRRVLAYSLNIVNKDTGNTLNTRVIEQGIHSERVDNLSPATTYKVSVRAYNTDGASSFSDVLVITTYEKEPSAAPMIRITKTTATSIALEWDELPRKQRNGVIVGYKVFYQKEGETAIKTDEDNNGGSRSFVIKGLEPNTKYRVRVLARTKIGYPDLKEDRWPWVHDKTQPRSRQNDSVPDPPTLTVISLNASSVNITWHQDVPRVPVTMYKVILKRLKDSDQSQHQYEVQPTKQNLILTDLLNETFYQVSLTASNQFGESGAVIEEFLTSENPPPPVPINLHATFLASRIIRVEWSQPEFYTDVMSYRVRYRPERGSPIHESIIITDRTRADIVDLMPYTYYYIEVQAVAGSRESKFSRSILERTQEDVPSVPRNIKVTIEQKSALVRWDAPAFPNGNITTYIIRYGHQSEEKWKSVKVNGSRTMVLIDNLKPGLNLVEVTACTSAGQGPRSKNSIHIHGTREQITAKPNANTSHPQQLGIILGITIGVVCIIICILIVLLRNKCFNNPPPGHPHVQAVRSHRNGHIPGLGNGHAVPMSDREMDPYTPMLDGHYENHLLDSKGCGSGNIIVTPNGTRVNGYVPFSNGLRNGHLHNGHVTTVIGYQNANQQEETRELIAAMLANDGNAVTDDRSHLYKLSSPERSSLDDIDKSMSGTDSDQNTSTGSAELPPMACCLDDGTTACCHDDDSGCHGDNSSCPLVGTYPQEDNDVTQARPPLEVDTQQGVRPPDPTGSVQWAANGSDDHSDGGGHVHSARHAPQAQLPPRAMPTTSAFSNGEDNKHQSSTSVSPQATSTSLDARGMDITVSQAKEKGPSNLAPQGTPTSGKGSPVVTPIHENTSSFQPNNLAPSAAVTVVRGNDNQSRPSRVLGNMSSSPRVPGVRGSYQQPPPPPYPGPRDLAMHHIPQDSLRRDHNAVAARQAFQDVAV